MSHQIGPPPLARRARGIFELPWCPGLIMTDAPVQPRHVQARDLGCNAPPTAAETPHASRLRPHAARPVYLPAVVLVADRGHLWPDGADLADPVAALR